MEQQAWEEVYQRFIRECEAKGNLEQRDRLQEQRQHPRFRMWSNVVWTSGEFQFSIVDLSISGVAFDTNQPFEPESRLVVRLSDLVSAAAVVLDCTAIDETPMFFAGRYRVRCRFEDSVQGLRFLVMVKDLQAIRIET